MITVALLFLLTCVIALTLEETVGKLEYFSKLFILSFSGLLATSIIALYTNAYISPKASVSILFGVMAALSIILLFLTVQKKRSRHLYQSKLCCLFTSALNHIIISDESVRRSIRDYSFTAKISISYLALLLIAACFLIPVNGDSQVYNLSRVLVSLLSSSIFLTQTSVPTQAFHSFAHDYLYTPDLLTGSTFGLGILSTVELIYTWILVDVVILHSASINRSVLTLHQIHRVRSIARIVLISMPALFYQATITKNDLFLAPLSISIAVMLYSFWHEEGSIDTRSTSPFWTSAIQLLCGSLLIYLSKGYGIVLLAVLVFVFFFLSPTKRGLLRKLFPIRSPLQANNSKARPIFFISTTLAVVIFSSALLFFVNRGNYWRESYSSFTAKHSVASIESLASVPLNLSRTLFESLINIPLPFHIAPGLFVGVYRSNQYLPLTDTYSFGGIINEDISWPGIIFNMAIFITVSFLFWSILQLRPNYYLRNRSALLPVLPLYLGFSGLISAFLIAALVYWQPYSSRFFIGSSVLLVPSLSFVLGHLIHLVPRRLTRLLFFSFISIALLSASIPIGKQYYVLYRQSSRTDYYLAKSMNTSSLSLNNIVSSLTLSPVIVCSRDDYSASLELLKLLRRFSLQNHEYKFKFPNLGVCNNILDSSDQPPSDFLIFGGGAPPRLKKLLLHSN